MNPNVQITTPEYLQLNPGFHTIAAVSDFNVRERITALIMTAMAADRYGIRFHVACTSPVTYKIFCRALGNEVVTRIYSTSPTSVDKAMDYLFRIIKRKNAILLLDAETSTFEMIKETSTMNDCDTLSAIIPVLPDKISKQAAADILKTLHRTKAVFLTLGSKREAEKHSFAIWEWSERPDCNPVWDYEKIPEHIEPYVIRLDGFADFPPLRHFQTIAQMTNYADPAERGRIAQVIAYFEASYGPVYQHLLADIAQPVAISLF